MARDINPATEPAVAYGWAREVLFGMQKRDQALARWQEALAIQVALGVARCRDVVDYNQASIKEYAIEEAFYTWLAPVSDEMAKQTGTPLLPFKAVPLPALIGTKYQVWTVGGEKRFDAGVTCQPDGNFAPGVAAQLQVSPQANCGLSGVAGPGHMTMQYLSPHPTLTDLRHQGPLGQLGLTVAELAAGTVLAAVVAWGATKILDRAISLAKVVTGQMRDELAAKEYTKYVEAQANRAQAISRCMQERITAAQGAQTPEQIAQWQAECDALSPKPDKPPYPSSLIAGLTGLLIAGGVVVLAVAVVRRGGGQRRAAPAHDDE